MANTFLNTDKFLRAALAIMHQKSNFIMRVNRQYDGSFANKGAQIGQALRLGMPPKFTGRTGNTMSSQNIVERKIDLPLATIKGIDFEITQEQLTFSIEDLTKEVIAPAASQLVALVEEDAFSMYKSVPNYVGIVTTTVGSGLTYDQFDDTRTYLAENLAPSDARYAALQPRAAGTFRKDTKSLFQSSDNIRDQYVEGLIGRTGGCDVYENTIMPSHTTGTVTTTTTILVTTSAAADTGLDGTGNAYSNTPFDLKVDGFTTWAPKKGDIITISGVNDVHPETKQDLGYLKRFVVAADASLSSAGTVTILPVPIRSGAYQNVSAAIANNAQVTIHGPANGGAAVTYGQNLVYHKDAFIFVTADLADPTPFGGKGGRRVEDNVSLRVWFGADIVNGKFPGRLDIAYGYVAAYPEWAARHTYLRQ